MRYFLHLILIFCLPVSALQANALRAVASDLFSPALREAMRNTLSAGGLTVNFSFDGSFAGWQAMQAGNADFGILVTSDELRAPEQFDRIVLAFQVAKIAVHESNPIASLSFAQLRDIFVGGGGTNNWRVLLTDPAWSNRPMTFGAYRGFDSMVLELFRATVIQGDSLRRAMRFGASVEELMPLFLQNANAIVILPAVADARNFRFVPVQGSGQSEAYSPTVDNVYFGDYLLRMPFYLVFSPDIDPARKQDLIRLFYSDAMIAAFEAANFMSIPQTERDALLQRFGN